MILATALTVLVVAKIAFNAVGVLWDRNFRGYPRFVERYAGAHSSVVSSLGVRRTLLHTRTYSSAIISIYSQSSAVTV